MYQYGIWTLLGLSKKHQPEVMEEWRCGVTVICGYLLDFSKYILHNGKLQKWPLSSSVQLPYFSIVTEWSKSGKQSWTLHAYSQEEDVASHTCHVASINFLHEYRDLQFNVDSEEQFFENFFMEEFLSSEFLPQIC